MYHTHSNARLSRVPIKRLRPTQITVGLAEVAVKARQWSRLGKKERKVQLEHHIFPAVLGPGRDFYIVDHHHLGIALLQAGVDEVSVAVMDDMSWLTRAIFWRTMEFRSWSHPYDSRGNRCEYQDMPRRLTELEDDPYRSLAGLVRNAGGFAKNEAPFSEFLWADFFRPLVPKQQIRRSPSRAIRLGLRLARSDAARYLPGWSGVVSI
jgi:hypothetical protein